MANLREYKDIINFSKINQEYYTNTELFKNLIRLKFPYIYEELFKVLSHDKGFQDYKLYKDMANIYLDAYAFLIEWFDTFYLDKNIKFDILSIYDKIPNILCRATFNKLYPDLYNMLHKLELFDNIETDNNYISIYLKNMEYGLGWNSILDLMKIINKCIPDYYHIPSMVDIFIDTIYTNHINFIEILEELISYTSKENNDAIFYPFRSIFIEYLSTEFIESIINKATIQDETLFKYLYKNKIFNMEDMWEFISAIIYNKNEELLKWVIENTEKSYLDNEEFNQKLKNLLEDDELEEYNSLLKNSFKK
jgi:hypothetical protein